MRIGFVGHQRLHDPSRWNWVKNQVEHILAGARGPVTGVGSLAVGADRLFAAAVIGSGNSFEAIIPFAGYERTFRDKTDRQEYFRLLNSANKVAVLERHGSDEQAYLEAGKKVVKLCDFLLAVWDGKPAAGLGGTGDIVRYARDVGRSIVHIDPATLRVTEY